MKIFLSAPEKLIKIINCRRLLFSLIKLILTCLIRSFYKLWSHAFDCLFGISLGFLFPTSLAPPPFPPPLNSYVCLWEHLGVCETLIEIKAVGQATNSVRVMKIINRCSIPRLCLNFAHLKHDCFIFWWWW